MDTPHFKLLIVGSELLTGKRQDRHLGHIIEILDARGLSIRECRIVGDHVRSLTHAIRDALTSDQITFSLGGIGATPDDVTRACAADAAQVPLTRHPDAEQQILDRFGPDSHPHRIRMADLPEGASLIPNPYNQIPGFTLQGTHHACHFFPGFPQMAYPMIEWVLDHHYPGLQAPRETETLIHIHDATETDLMETLQAMDAHHPEISLSCLPHLGPNERRIELGLRGQSGYLDAALRELKQRLDDLDIHWH